MLFRSISLFFRWFAFYVRPRRPRSRKSSLITTTYVVPIFFSCMALATRAIHPNPWLSGKSSVDGQISVLFEIKRSFTSSKRVIPPVPSRIYYLHYNSINHQLILLPLNYFKKLKQKYKNLRTKMVDN